MLPPLVATTAAMAPNSAGETAEPRMVATRPGLARGGVAATGSKSTVIFWS